MPYIALRVRYSPDGRFLASAGYDGKVVVRDATSGRIVQIFPIGPAAGGVDDIAFSPDSRHLATANFNSTVYIIRLPRPEPNGAKAAVK